MDNNPYRVSGVGVPIRLGREREWKRILSQVERNHLSIIGPRYMGKTVLVYALAQQCKSGHGPFHTSLYWDLRHNTPGNDEQFYTQFAGVLAATLRSVRPEYAYELQASERPAYEDIRAILDLLREESIAILFCMDGWDRLLLDTDITRNLLDNLRSLAEWPTVRLVTASRRRLRELCASPDARTSDFHNIFGNPLSLTALAEEEVTGFLAPFGERGVVFGPGATKELFNWTGGIPVLLASCCRDLWDSVEEGGTVSKEMVDGLGEDLHRQCRDTLEDLWQDCTAEQQAFVSRVHAEDQFETNPTDGQLVAALKERGFLAQDKGRARICCRSLASFLSEGAGGTANQLHSLFGEPGAFSNNTKGLLQLRFATLNGADEELADYLRNAIDNVGKPHVMIRNVRALVERSFALIWAKELPDRKIPPEWTEEWRKPDRDGNEVRNPPEGNVPGRLGQQCRLLDLMTDARKLRRTSIRRSTYVLINGLQSVGDHGQHPEGEPIPMDYAVAVCFSALQLVRQLTEDLRGT